MRSRHWQEITATIGTFLFILFCFTSSTMGSVAKDENRREILNRVHSLQIPFIENAGQIKDKSVKYYAKTFGGTVFITRDGNLVYSLPRFINHQSSIENNKSEGWVIKESFVGANISDVKAEDRSTTRVNHFKGKDPSRWRRSIPTYNLVSLGEIYNGIGLKLKAYGNNVEKLFYVKPNGNAERIKLRIEGAKRLKVNKTGELELETGLGAVKFTKPVAYQEINGKRVEVAVAYSLLPNPQSLRAGGRSRPEAAIQNPQYVYGFKLGDYDRTKGLVIDPLLASTFLGGSGGDEAMSITIDSSGNVYVTGGTRSMDFPTSTGAYDTSFNGDEDIFISKLDPDLQNLLASTFLGGAGEDLVAKPITIDSSGNVYVAGETGSTDFPTITGAYDDTFNGDYDAFVSKLDSNLENLLASTFLGGADGDTAFSLDMDSSGNVFVAGTTGSSDFPVNAVAYDTTHNGSLDIFVSKLDGNLQSMLASTFIGGTGAELGGVFLDSSGNVYVGGATDSTDFPIIAGAYDTTYNGAASCDGNGDGNGDDDDDDDDDDDFDICGDAFVSKLDSNLENLLASTFLGGAGLDGCLCGMIDSSGNVYVAGETTSTDFPATAGAYDTTFNGVVDGFVSRLDSNLQNLLASTFLGGAGDDSAESMTIDSNGNVYVAGETHSSDFPITTNAYDTTYNDDPIYCGGGDAECGDAFISKLDSNLQSLLASTFLGSDLSESAKSIAIGSNGDVYVTGYTGSMFFPATAGAYDTTYDGYRGDAFIAKFDSNLTAGGHMVTSELWIRAVINTEEKGPIEAVWQKGGEDTTDRGDRVIWGHFYASPSDVTWGSQDNPDLFVKVWFDVSGRIDVNYFHVSVPDIEVYSDFPYDGTPDEQGTTTMDWRYIRQYYQNGQSYSEENYEDGYPPAGYWPTGDPSGYLTINDLRIGSIINTVEKGPIDALWRLGGQDTTSRGDQVVWGHFYASPTDVTWGSENNPDLFVKIWFDVSGRVDVNFFHVSVPDIEVYSDLPNDNNYDNQGTTIMSNRYIRHEYWR